MEQGLELCLRDVLAGVSVRRLTRSALFQRSRQEFRRSRQVLSRFRHWSIARGAAF